MSVFLAKQQLLKKLLLIILSEYIQREKELWPLSPFSNIILSLSEQQVCITMSCTSAKHLKEPCRIFIKWIVAKSFTVKYSQFCKGYFLNSFHCNNPKNYYWRRNVPFRTLFAHNINFPSFNELLLANIGRYVHHTLSRFRINTK